MALPGSYTYRYDSPQYDFLDTAAHQQQLVIPPARTAGNAQLAGLHGFGGASGLSGGISAQPWPATTHSGIPNLHIHPGATVHATIHMNVYPDSNHANPHHVFSPHLQPSNTSASPPSYCRFCDYTFASAYLLNDHKALNPHHCPYCRHCFASWEAHIEAVPHTICPIDGCGRSYSSDDEFREHFWVAHSGGAAFMRGGGRVLGEVDGPQERWVVEERVRTRRGRSRTRRRSRGRYGGYGREGRYFLCC